MLNFNADIKIGVDIENIKQSDKLRWRILIRYQVIKIVNAFGSGIAIVTMIIVVILLLFFGFWVFNHLIH